MVVVYASNPAGRRTPKCFDRRTIHPTRMFRPASSERDKKTLSMAVSGVQEVLLYRKEV